MGRHWIAAPCVVESWSSQARAATGTRSLELLFLFAAVAGTGADMAHADVIIAPALPPATVTGTGWKDVIPTAAVALVHAGEPRIADPGNHESGAAERPASDGNTDADKEKEKAPSTCSSSSQENPSTNMPVIIATGEKILPQDDFFAGSSYGIAMTRTYRSKGTSSSFFGPNWASSLDFPVLSTYGCVKAGKLSDECLGPARFTVTFPGGAKYTYYNTNGTGWTYAAINGSKAMGSVQYNAVTEEATLTLDKQRYRFAGLRLQSISTLGGATLLTVTYGANASQPARITNIAGQYVDLTWANNKVSTIRDPAGGIWSYGYNAAGMLSTVTSPGTSPDIRTYLYEDAADGTRLTGLLINGVRYSTYRYDSSGRVIESGLAGGEERDTFSYATNATTVTSATGQAITYNFVAAQGGLKLSSTSRSATSTCPPAGPAASMTPTAGSTTRWTGTATARSTPTTPPAGCWT